MNPRSAKPFSCLLVDDDAGFAGMLARIVSEEGGRPVVCHSLREARAEIQRHSFDVAILDNGLPDGTGYEFYPQLIRSNAPQVVVMITGGPELSQAVELTRNGLFDYLTKPLSAEDFAGLLRRAKLRLGRSQSDGQEESLLGNSPAMSLAITELQQAARHGSATVLLLGETGTGKDLAARFLHRLSFGVEAPKTAYVPVNCPNIPGEMFEAELFGSEKGAYTGADRRRTGLIEAAQGGTLFLDEVAEIPLALQPKLLRFLESREYRPLGETSTRHFTGRVVAATNRDLQKEAAAGRFREDLLYRLDVFSVRLPPLREHLEDVRPIAEALLTQLCERYERARPSLEPEDLAALQSYHFPGNVRELRNLLERSLLRTDPACRSLEMDLGWLKRREPAAEPVAVRQTPARELSPIERQEYELISRTLQEERGAIRRAASRLGLTHQALLRRLQKWPELRP